MNNPDSARQPQLFHCPTCGAGLPIPETATIKCTYCGSSVVVPAELRPRAREVEENPPVPVVIQFSPSAAEEDSPRQKSRAGLIIGCVVLVVVLSVLVTGVLAAAGIFATTRTVSEVIDTVSTIEFQPTSLIPTIIVQLTDLPISTPVPANNPVLQFGSEGTGPGQFQDARHIAVDADGNIFVADYDTGRLQKFDPTGKFLQLINVENNQNNYAFIMDMAVDYAGHLYVVRVPDILSYNTADLSKSQSIPGRFPEINYRFLAIDPANQLYAVSDGVQFTDLIKMDSTGAVQWTVQGAIFNLDQRANPSVDDVAADGLGTSYLVNDIDARVYKFDAGGKFIDRFGVKGDAPGELDNPSRIVVDPQGRLAISDLDGIDFFTTEGVFLDGMPWDYSYGGIRGFAFDFDGRLYVITTNQQVLKFELSF